MKIVERGKMLTVREVAPALGVSEKKVRAMIANNEIPHHRYGRMVRITQADLDDFIEATRVEATEPLPRARRRRR